MSEEGFIIPPDKVKKKLEQQGKNRVIVEAEEDEIEGSNQSQKQQEPPKSKRPSGESPIKSKPIVDRTRDSQKFRNLGEKIRVEFESGGRFDLPQEAYFEDYDARDITSLVTSREEDILETLIHVMDKCKSSDSGDFSMGDATPEEFFEAQIGIKVQFDSPYMTYRWMCDESDCQEDVAREKRKFSEQEIDLSEITYVSIENLEKEIQAQYLEAFKNEEFFKQYLDKKYNGNPPEGQTPELEAITVRVQEPQNLIDSRGNHYRFRFMRMKDLVRSYQRVSQKYDPLIRQIKSRKYSGVSDQSAIRFEREKELKEVNKKKAEDAILTSQALCMVSFNEQTDLSEDKKVEIFEKLDRKSNMDLMRLWDMCKYGIRHEMEVTCNHCGAVSRRSLQRGLSPLDLVPFNDDGKSDSVKRLQRSPSVNIFFG